MRWLLLKDLQILRRSPLLTALLVIYPIVLAVLIGFAISRSPDKPRVAFLNEIPPSESLEFGGDDGGFDQQEAFAELCSRVECVKASSRDDALDKVRDGEVLGALIVPEDFIDKLEAQLGGAGLESASVEVYVNEDDPVKARLVDDRISSLLTEANLILSDRISEGLLSYLDILVSGGEIDLPILGQRLDVLGLQQSEAILRAVRSDLSGPQRQVVDQVIRFAILARQNLGFADELLSSASEPIAVDKEVVSGDVPPLDTFAISVAIAVTLMFVTVLLVAGSLALEREENTFTRLTRGLVGRTALLVEKIALGTIASLVVAVVLLAVLELFVSLRWARRSASPRGRFAPAPCLPSPSPCRSPSSPWSHRERSARRSSTRSGSSPAPSPSAPPSTPSPPASPPAATSRSTSCTWRCWRRLTWQSRGSHCGVSPRRRAPSVHVNQP
jgi:hypothetical protein